MFNSKLKQQIAVLEAANEQLQAQYDTVFGLLQQRQDQVLDLQAQIQVLRANQQDNNGRSFINSVKEVQERLSNRVSNLQDVVEELRELYSDSDSDSESDEDSDEDEDEDEDDSWDE